MSNEREGEAERQGENDVLGCLLTNSIESGADIVNYETHIV